MKRPWLATITRQLAANWRRKQRPQALPPEQLPEQVAPDLPTVTWPFCADRAGLSDPMVRALGQLEETSRACLLLKVIEGLSFAEIAKLLDIPINTAMSHAHRARQTLAKALTPHPDNQPDLSTRS